MTTRLDFSTLDLMDALDLAVLIEYEAYKRYKFFQSQLGGGETANVFAEMATNEAKHGQELEARRKARFGDTPRRVSMDDIYDVEAPDQGAVRATMSVEQAFKVALSAEKKARDFYDGALEYVKDDEIKALFVELRDEEIEHVNMVEDILGKLPDSAKVEVEVDEDELAAL